MTTSKQIGIDECCLRDFGVPGGIIFAPMGEGKTCLSPWGQENTAYEPFESYVNILTVLICLLVVGG